MARKWISIGPSASLNGQGVNGPPVAGRVTGLSIAPGGERLYLASAGGGIWRSDDGGRFWRPLMDGVRVEPRHPDYETADLAESFTGVSTLACGAVACHPDDPDRVYAGTGDFAATNRGERGVGVLMSDDGGRIWIREPVAPGGDSLEGAVVFELAVDPGDRERAMAATSRGLYRRGPDGGGGFHWEQRRVHPASGDGTGLDEETTSVVAARRGNQTTWFLAQRGGGVYRSGNDGAAWEEAASGLAVDPADALRLGVKFDDPDLLYALVSSGKLLRTDLAAASPAWEEATGFPPTANGAFGGAEGERHLAIAVSPADRDQVFFGGGRSLNTAGGGSAAWTAALYRADLSRATGSLQMAFANIGRSVPPYVNALAFPPGNADRLWVGGDSGVWETDTPRNMGEIFEPRNTGLAVFRMGRIAQHPEQESVLLAGTEGNGCLRYTGDPAWRAAYNMDARYQRDTGVHLGDVRSVAVNWADPYRILLAAAPGTQKAQAAGPAGRVALFIRKTDGGHNPDPPDTEEITLALAAGDAVESFSPMVANSVVTPVPAEADRVAFGTRQLWISDDFGAAGSWNAAGNLLPSPIRSIVFAGHARIFVGCMGGEVYRYTDGPGGWNADRLDAQPGLPAGGDKIAQPVTDIAVDPGDPARIYIAFGGRGVFDRLWFYDGSAWSSRHHPAAPAHRQLPQIGANALAVDPGNADHLYVGTDGGVWHSTDGGNLWEPLNEGLPEVPVHQLLIHGPRRLLRAATSGRGVFELHLDEETADLRLFVRDHLLDVGRRTAYALPADDPTDDNSTPGSRRQIAAGDWSSPDIRVDAPDVNLNHQFAPDACVDYLDFSGRLADEAGSAAFDPALEPGRVVNHVYVRVHNQGGVWGHGVQVTLLAARLDAGAAPELPNDFDIDVRRGSEAEGNGWQTVGLARVRDVRAGVPAVVRFALSAEFLATFGPLSGGDEFVLLALLHHPGDPFENAERNPATLATGERKTALKKITLTALFPAAAALIPTEPNRWKPIGPSGVRRGQAPTKPVVSGRVPAIAVAAGGNRIYIGTANAGVWRSDDKGRTWRPTMTSFDEDPANPGHWTPDGVDSLSVGAIAIDPAHPDIVFVGTGEGHHGYQGVGVTRSGDGGRNWSHPESSSHGLNGQGFFGLAMDPANHDHLVGATTTGVFRRDGTGPTMWNRIAMPGMNAWDRATHATATRSGGTTRFFVAVRHDHGVAPARDWRGHVFFSDNGTVWNPIPGFPQHDDQDLHRITLAVPPGNIRVVYALDNKGRVHRAEQSGPNWGAWVTLENIPGGFPNDQGTYNQAIAVDPGSMNVVFIGGKSITRLLKGHAGSVFRLTISGNRASQADFIGNSVHPDIHSFAFPPGNTGEMWLGCDGGIYYAADASATGDHVFQDRNPGIQSLEINAIDRHPTSETVLFGGTQDNGGIRYTGEESWLHVTSGDGGYPVVHQTDPHRYIITYIKHDMSGADHGGVWELFDFSKEVKGIDNDEPLFYAPLVRCLSGNPDRLAFGTRALWLGEDFGRNWKSLPNDGDSDRFGPKIEGDDKVWDRRDWAIRAIEFPRPGLILVGLRNGEVHRYTEDAGGNWVRVQVDTDPTPAGPPNFNGLGQPVMVIRMDPADAANDSFFVGMGGTTSHRFWRYDGAAGEWERRMGAVGNRLPNSMVNALIADPGNPAHLYAGTDIGVWHSPDGGANWNAFSTGLPDTAVTDLEWHNAGPRLLRAATYGFGVWEIVVGPANVQQVELFLRNSPLDGAREGVVPAYGPDHPDPTSKERAPTFFGGSQDVKIDTPRDDGAFQRLNAEVPTFTEFVDEIEDRADRVAVAAQPIVSRIYIQVHNRGSLTADDVEVVVLATANPPAALPADYRTPLLAGLPLNTGDWSFLGRKRLSGVRAHVPQVVRFDLPPSILPSPAEVADGPVERGLLVLVHHPVNDPFLGNEVDVQALCDNHRQATFKRFQAVAFTGTLPQTERAIPPYVPNLLPLAVALRTREKLADHSTAIGNRLGNPLASVQPTDRRMHTLLNQAFVMFDGGDPVPRVPGATLAWDVSRYAVLGASAFDIPDFVDVLSPEPGWLADVMRRGTPDANLSQVIVAAGEFAARAGEIAVARAESDADREKIQAFVMGLMSALASHVTVNPVLREMQRGRGPRDWDHRSPGIDDLLANRWIAEHLLGNAPSGGDWQNWWPDPGEVPDALFEGFAEALREACDPESARTRAFADRQAEGIDGFIPDGDDLRQGYAFFYRSMGSGMHWAVWWLLLTPILIMGPIALLISRFAMPNAKLLFAEVAGEGGEIQSGNEASWYELYMTSMATGSVMPMVYSMILWNMVPRGNDYFIQALVFGILRLGLAGAMFGTTGVSAGLRWGLFFSLSTVFDLYFMIRSIVEAAERRPGNAHLYLLQVFPLMTAVSNLIFGGLTELTGLKKDWQFWLLWSVWTAGLVFGLGMPIGLLLANRGGLYDLLTNRPNEPATPLDFLDPASVDAPRPVPAALFGENLLWSANGGAPEDRRYPSGRRALVKVWWTGGGDLEIRHDPDRVIFRTGGADTEVALDGPLTGQEIADQLSAALAGVQTAVFGPDDPSYPLPAPQMLADSGDDALTWNAHDAAVALFEPVGTSEDDAYILRHSPRSAFRTALGIAEDCTGVADIRLLPENPGDPLEGTAVDLAADLAAMLCAGAVPGIHGGDLNVPGLAADAKLEKVHQIFRQWNLNERRVNEWKMLFLGGADSEKEGQPDRADPGMRAAPEDYVSAAPEGEPMANALGWVPAFRAWTGAASDPAIDTSANRSHRASPLFRPDPAAPRKPVARELTDAMRFLFDLP